MEPDGTQGNPAGIPTTSDAPGTNALASLTPVKEKKTAEELASMIRQDLSEVDACPRRGVNVTVYGLNPWNSMLTFGVDAGPVHNKAYLQSFCDIITERCGWMTSSSLPSPSSCGWIPTRPEFYQ